ncbi:MAG: phage gp6-like head-tail connector protein [Synergistaceae bacterium]|nr:phage gp6-like head-tail connector protein [Synergistaceae bacterium]MBR0254060.1 phage gp6-like head-tail connector protein [Synergistaceae bacterium]
MTLKEACDVLRVDEGANDELISSLISAMPDYITLSTGMQAEQQAIEPLVKTVEKFLLTLWYFGDRADDVRLNRVINNLLIAISCKVDVVSEMAQ